MARHGNQRRMLAGLGLAGLALAIVSSSGQQRALARSDGDDAPEVARTITLTGVVRDFKGVAESGGGHPDFEIVPAGGYGHYTGNVANELSSTGNPVFTGQGKKVRTQWRDSAGRNINPLMFNASRGDRAGAWGDASRGGISSADSFNQWFEDSPGVNLSMPLPLTLVWDEEGQKYVFDDRTDPTFSGRGGFFPINNELFGNSPGWTKNFHFTFELDTEFVYKRGTGQIFKFRGDDDVWVYIDGKLVIDIAGIHSAIEQTIELDRLDWLQDNRVYDLKFFFAERHTTQSNFRIETTLNLRTAELPNTSNLYD